MDQPSAGLPPGSGMAPGGRYCGRGTLGAIPRQDRARPGAAQRLGLGLSTKPCAHRKLAAFHEVHHAATEAHPLLTTARNAAHSHRVTASAHQ